MLLPDSASPLPSSTILDAASAGSAAQGSTLGSATQWGELWASGEWLSFLPTLLLQGSLDNPGFNSTINGSTINGGAAVPILPALGLFLGCLLLLAWLSRQIAIYLQLPVYALTRSQDAAAVGLFLVFFPGVIIHESAHWLAARLLGLRTGAFRVWPRRQGKYIGLGSVSVQRSDPLRDSLVGMAPLLLGSALVAAIGHQVFNVNTFAAEFTRGELWPALRSLPVALESADGAIWAYLLFAVANAMMPSASDREPLKPVLLYGGVAILLYLGLRLPLAPVTTLLIWITPTLQALVAAFLFVIVLNFVVLAVLFLVRQILPV